MRSHPRRAFSIPELLAVVAIILIIIAMLMPSLIGSRTATYQAMCGTNLHQLHVAFENQRADAKGNRVDVLSAYSWPSQLAPYVSDQSIYICQEQFYGSTSGYSGEDEPEQSTEALYLKVYNAYPNGYLYDMSLVEGPLCRRVDRNTSDATIAQLWSNAPGAGNTVKSFRDSLPSTGNAYLLCFEDLRPDGGDKDYEDVILQFEETDEGVKITFKYDGAGYQFDMMQGDQIVWAKMDNNGDTRIGATVIVQTSPASYGMNVHAASAVTSRGVVLMLDYIRTGARGGATGWDPWNDWLLPDGRYRFARHYRKANVLFRGGQVRLMHPDTFNPAVSIYRRDYWEGTP